MTEADLEFIWNNMVLLFGSRMPNPEREPRRFAYYVRLYKHLVKIHQGNL